MSFLSRSEIIPIQVDFRLHPWRYSHIPIWEKLGYCSVEAWSQHEDVTAFMFTPEYEERLRIWNEHSANCEMCRRVE